MIKILPILIIALVISLLLPQQLLAHHKKERVKKISKVEKITYRQSIHIKLGPDHKKKVTKPTPTPKTTVPTPTTPPVTPTPEKTPAPAPITDEKKAYIMDAINKYRASQGLSSVTTNDVTCSFAKVRAAEITRDFSHKGFQDRINSGTLPYSGYSRITENLAMTSNYKEVVDLWINSPGHAANMRDDTPYVCVEYDGNYYAYEGWKP